MKQDTQERPAPRDAGRHSFVKITLMGIVIKILVLILGLGFGVALIKYNYQITHLFGHNSLAEQYLGSGGTYTMWRLLGIVVILVTLWYVFH
jgi:hypothetical protein